MISAPLPVAARLALPRTRSRRKRWILSPVLAVPLALVFSLPTPSKARETLLLVGSDAYPNLHVSSVYGVGHGAEMLVDNDPNTAWAIAGISDSNPQGRDEGWVSFDLAQQSILSKVFFTPREASGSVDGIDQLQLWAAIVPFGVDVTSKASTDAFLSRQLVPLLEVNGFSELVTPPYTYIVQREIVRYFLVRLLNTTDSRGSRNLGAKQLLLQVTVPVPAPLPAFGVGCGWLWARRLRRRSLQCHRLA
jgi:hypothetical protein